MTLCDAFESLSQAGLSVFELDGRLGIWPGVPLRSDLRRLVVQHQDGLLSTAAQCNAALARAASGPGAGAGARAADRSAT